MLTILIHELDGNNKPTGEIAQMPVRPGWEDDIPYTRYVLEYPKEILANTRAALCADTLRLMRRPGRQKPYVDYLLHVDRLLDAYNPETYTTASSWLFACMRAYIEMHEDKQTAIAYLAGAMTCITRGHIGTRLEDILSEALREEE